MIGITLLGGGGGTGSGIQIVADTAARLALPVSDGKVVMQLDNDSMYEYDLGTAAWVKIGGLDAPNKLAGYNASGEPYAITQWSINAHNGLVESLNLTPIDSGAPSQVNLNDAYITLSPAANIPNDDFVGYRRGISTNGAVDFKNIFGDYINVDIQHAGTTNLVYGNNFNMYQAAGNTLQTAIGNSFYGNFDGTVSGGVQGYTVGPNFNVGSAVNSFSAFSTNPGFHDVVTSATMFEAYGYGASAPTNFIGVQISPNYTGTMNFYTGFNAGGSNATTFNAFNANPAGSGTNFTAFNTGSSGGTYTNVIVLNGGASGFGGGAGTTYTGAILSPNTNFENVTGISIAPSGSGSNLSCIDISPSGTYTTGVGGININMSSVTNASNAVDRKDALSINGGVINANVVVRTQSNTFVDSINTMAPNLVIDAAAPISNTSVFGHNLANVITANDDFGNGPLGMSVGCVAYVGQISVAAGKTIGGISMAVSGGNISGPGTITDLVFYDILGGIDGGAADVTNMYGLRFQNNLGLAPTNIWGLYFDVAGAENYLSTSLAIETASKKVSNSSVGLEIGGTTKALRLSVLTTAQKNALTALEGMTVFDSDLNALFFYDGAAWVQPAAGYAFTAGSVAFAGAGGDLTEDNANFFWDDTNNRLGIGTTTPSCALDIHTTIKPGIQVSDTSAQSTTNGATISVIANDGSAMLSGNKLGHFGIGGAYDNANGIANASVAMMGFAAENWNAGARGADIEFWTTANGTATRALAATIGQDKKLTVEGEAKVKNVIQLGSVDPFSRTQIWNYGTNASLRLGSLSQDGDPADVSSEGSVFYGPNSQGTAINSGTGDFGYARVKADRFGLYTSILNVAGYYFRVDPTSLYLATDALAKTFEVTRATGAIKTSMGAGIVHSDASGNLTSSAVSLTADVSGALPLANGGTNKNITAVNGGLVYTDADSMEVSSAGTSGQLLKSGGAGAPTWFNQFETQGTFQTGTSISAGTQITPIVGTANIVFVAGNGGAVTSTATEPFITTGMSIGQKMTIIGTDDTNTVTYNNQSKLLLNGSYTLAKGYTLDLMYVGTDGSNAQWIETARSH